jgi:hypothetical protein
VANSVSITVRKFSAAVKWSLSCISLVVGLGAGPNQLVVGLGAGPNQLVVGLGAGPNQGSSFN